MDITEYSEALEQFLMEMEKISDVKDERIQDIIGRPASMLRIAQIRTTLYDNPMMEKQGKGHSINMYQKENADADAGRCYELRRALGNGTVVHYYASQIVDDPDWNEEERHKVAVLIQMLFVFNGRARVMKQAEYLTFHDRQLGIYNLSYFFREMDTLIAQGRMGEFGGCYFNLRRFSLVNDRVGRERGTEIMKRYVNGLSALLSGEEAVCRVGGDNFAVLFRKDHLDLVLDYLKGVPVNTDASGQEQVLVSASAGIYLDTENITAATEVMDRLSVANTMAKRSLQDSVVYCNDKLLEQLTEVKQIQNLFPSAIAQEEFQVYYQPKIRITDCSLAGAEALCRWVHNGEMITPNRFIPVFEQTRDVCELDFYMLERVCMHLRQWLDEGRPVVKVSVNLSRCHFGDVNLLKNVLDIVDRYRIPHEYIEIELTETTTDVDFQDLRRIVFGLRSHGISTSVDDFGVGYSSLNLIRELPWDVLKLDKSFISEHSGDSLHGKTMLKYVIAMAQEMGMECIVEGVETEEQLNLLRENNCCLAQGFYFDRPMTKEAFEQRMAYYG